MTANIDSNTKQRISPSSIGQSMNIQDQKKLPKNPHEDPNFGKSLQRRHRDQAAQEAYITPGKLSGSSAGKDSGFITGGFTHNLGTIDDLFTASAINMMEPLNRPKSPLRVSNFLLTSKNHLEGEKSKS